MLNLAALEWPDWLGTPSQFALFVVIVLALIKIWPVIRQQNIDFTAAARKAYDERIKSLETDLKECERKCDEREILFRNEIDTLKTKLNNEAWQRVQSEISLVSTLVAVVPNEELKIILEALQRRSALLPAAITAIGGNNSEQ